MHRMRSFDDVLKLEKECGFNAFRFASPTFTPWEAAFWLYRYDDRVLERVEFGNVANP